MFRHAHVPSRILRLLQTAAPSMQRPHQCDRLNAHPGISPAHGAPPWRRSAPPRAGSLGRCAPRQCTALAARRRSAKNLYGRQQRIQQRLVPRLRLAALHHPRHLPSILAQSELVPDRQPRMPGLSAGRTCRKAPPTSLQPPSVLWRRRHSCIRQRRIIKRCRFIRRLLNATRTPVPWSPSPVAASSAFSSSVRVDHARLIASMIAAQFITCSLIPQT